MCSMEVSKLDKSILTYDGEIIDIPNVSRLLHVLKELDLNNILDVYNREFNIIEEKINNLYNSNEENKIPLLGSYIQLSFKFLKKGIKLKDIKYILISFRLFKILCFSPIEILKFKKISKEDYQCLEKGILKFLMSVNLNLSVFKNLDLNEMINKGFDNNNISSVKPLILIINDNFIFYSGTEFLEYLLYFLKESNFQLFINLFLETQNLQKVFFLLKNLNKENLKVLSKDKNLTNKWLIFGVINKILELFKEEQDDEIIIILGDLILRTKKDYNFFKQLILNYNNDCLFNCSLGYIFPKLSPSEFNKTIEECFIIDKYSFNLKSKDKFLEKYQEFSEKENYNKLLKIIFYKWIDFLEDCYTSEDYLIDIVITDFANFILQYYYFSCSDEEVTNEIVECLKTLNNIDSIWSSSYISLSNKFCINLSKLFILSIIFDFNKIENSLVNELFIEFYENEILKSKFRIRDKELYFEKIKNNILH